MSNDNEPGNAAQPPIQQGSRYPARKYNVFVFILAIVMFTGISIGAGIAAAKDEGLLMAILIVAGTLAIFVLPLLILLLGNWAWYELSPGGITYKFPLSQLKIIKWSEVMEFGPTGGSTGRTMDFMIKDNKGTKIIIGGSTPNIPEILSIVSRYLQKNSPEVPGDKKSSNLKNIEDLTARLKAIRRRGYRMAVFLVVSLLAYFSGCIFVMSLLDIRSLSDVTILIVVALFIIVLLAIFFIFFNIGKVFRRKDPLCPSCGRTLREPDLVLRTSKCPLCGKQIL